MISQRPKVLIVDLNNFARYPTLAVGYLVALLRAEHFEVAVHCPLSYGVPSLPREKVEGPFDHIERRLSYSTRPSIAASRKSLGLLRSWWRALPQKRVLRHVLKALAERPDVVLVSTYLDSYALCVEIARAAAELGVPVVFGGPAFNQRRIAELWRTIPGATAIVGAEIERELGAFVRDVLAGADLARHPGVVLPDGSAGPPAAPLAPLDGLPLPDFSDFPWDAYPNRVVPLMTGRGCGWAACTFCADIVTVNGRTYRTRRLESVLAEMEEQSKRYATRNFALLDIKLNSDLAIWDGLLSEVQERLPGARWIGTVHVGTRGRNGLERDELRAARAAGMTRVTFGLESGSQRLLDAMDKGTDLERCSRFLVEADAAGLSVRTTVIQGYPGEGPADLDLTSAYLERHAHAIDRVRLNRFNALPGTRFEREYGREPERFPGLVDLRFDDRFASSSYRYVPSEEPAYRRSMARLLGVVHAINRRPLKEEARQFDGLM